MLLNKENNFISAVLYIYNQEKNIAAFLEKLDACLEEIFEQYEIICVDDASSDQSVREIKHFADTHRESMVSVLHMSFYQGLELSMNAGVDLAIGDFVYEFDSPGPDCPFPLVQEIYYHTRAGYDIVAAAPRKQNHRASALFYSVFNRAARNQYLLRTELFRILSRRAINRVQSMSTVIPYRKAVYANCGLSNDVVFFEAEAVPRKVDKRTRRSQREIAVDVLVMYTDLAYHCSVLFSLAMMAIVAGSGLYTIFIYCSGRPVAGWTTTMLFLSACFLGIFAILTILIKYLSIILKLNLNRQKYVVESIEKLR